MTKIALTGAAGALGHQLRGPLAAQASALISTDIKPLQSETLANETFVEAELADLEAVRRVVSGADVVVHFGAIPDEAPWDDILQSNIIGAYNVWQAAKETGCKRIVYASSIHAVGMADKTTRITPESEHRPDTYYGLAKCFAEDLARMYWEKDGIEAACLRIYSCTPKPMNPRALGSWLSYGDLVRLVERCLDTPQLGFTVIYGVSNNDRCPVSNDSAAFLGYRPQDNAEAYAEEVFAAAGQIDPADPGQTRHGGPFAITPLGMSGVALMKKAEEEAG